MSCEAPQAALRVAIDAPLRSPFDYLPPVGVAVSSIAPGSRVRVPLGRREVVGVVVGHAEASLIDAAALKPVRELIDPSPVLGPELLWLLGWTAEYYHHPLGEVIAAALPKSLRSGAPLRALTEHWQISGAGTLALAALEPRRAPRQRALLTLLAANGGPVEAARLGESLPGWREAARALHARGWVERIEAATTALTGGAIELDDGLTEPPTLSAPQAAAVADIDAAASGFASFVLRGATGSGKTEVYLQCAMRSLARGSTVLVLVPEIGLTPQLVQRFRERLGVPIALMHSGLSDAERLASWRAAQSGQVRVVLGTRSAVFAPLPRLGLIVVDEEHDSSFKQHEGGCRYSGRDVAVMRAQHGGIPIVLGSATPAFESLLNLQRGRYRGLELPRREDQAPAPRLALVDLRAHALRQGLSDPVVEAMRRHLDARTVRCWCSSTGVATRPRCCAPPAAGSRPARHVMRA